MRWLQFEVEPAATDSENIRRSFTLSKIYENPFDSRRLVFGVSTLLWLNLVALAAEDAKPAAPAATPAPTQEQRISSRETYFTNGDSSAALSWIRSRDGIYDIRSTSCRRPPSVGRFWDASLAAGSAPLRSPS